MSQDKKREAPEIGKDSAMITNHKTKPFALWSSRSCQRERWPHAGLCRSHFATLNTKASNRPNHFSSAPTAPTLAGAARCHKQIIHAAFLDRPSPVFIKHCASSAITGFGYQVPRLTSKLLKQPGSGQGGLLSNSVATGAPLPIGPV